MKIKTLFNFLCIFSLLFVILIIFTLAFNKKEEDRTQREADFLSLLPLDTASFVRIKREFLDLQDLTLFFSYGILEQKAIDLLNNLSLKEVVEFNFQDSDFFLVKNLSLLDLKTSSFYDFSVQGRPIYFYSPTNLYFFQEKESLILGESLEALQRLALVLNDRQTLSLRDDLKLGSLWIEIDLESTLLGFYRRSSNFNINSPFLFSLQRGGIEIILLQPQGYHSKFKKYNLSSEEFNFSDNLAHFYGSRPGSELQLFQLLFLRDNSFFESLSTNYNLDLKKIIRVPRGEYQLYLFDNNHFFFITSAAIDLAKIKEAWRLFMAELYPQEIEKILPDGTKAIHLIREPAEFSFVSKELFGVDSEQLKKGDKELIITQISPFWIITTQEKLLERFLSQLKKKEKVGFWASLKRRLAQDKRTPLLSYEINPDRLKDLLNLKEEFLVFKKIEIRAFQEEGRVKFVLSFQN